MSKESNRGIKGILSHPKFYTLVQHALGKGAAARFVQDYIAPRPGERMLDIGCGPARILSMLDPSVDYTGFDPNASYINAAKRTYGARARLFVERIETYEPQEVGVYDIVTAIGVLHHLSDAAANRLMDIARTSMKPNGRLIALDTGFTKGQPLIARALAHLDRGQMMRYPEAHAHLAEPYFSDIEFFVRHNRLRIPYTHFIMRCAGPKTLAKREDSTSLERLPIES